MSLSINAKTYTADQFGADAVGYAGPNHTLTVVDKTQLSRVGPKATASFSGVGRTQAKLTRTLGLTGVLTPSGNAIITVNVSMPVGSAGADIDTLLNDMGAFVASASFKTHVKNQQISY